MSDQPPTGPRRCPWSGLPAGGILVAGILLVSVGVWWARRELAEKSPLVGAASADADDPRRTYTGPYRNIGPDVRYVGDAVCADCHADIAHSYAQHPMGRSLITAAELGDRLPYGTEAHNPFAALGRRFQTERQGNRLWHRQEVLDEAGRPVAALRHEVRWVVGSGTKGYSFLAERDGYVLQTPISWYTQKQRWDLSPSFAPSALTGRVVQASCLFCHVNRVRQHPEHIDRFEAPVFDGHAIGCERCHGPGELHARGDLDHTIVNPARLSPPLRDAVCEQCHLEGEARLLRSGRGLFDYRPGLALSDFWAVMVEPHGQGENARAVNHVEQMYQSRCFQRPVGGRKLGCITCHDPHVRVAPAARVAHYRSRCLQCHEQGSGLDGCSVPPAIRRQTSPQDSCIDCHMPRYASADVAHTASTDHRIVRRPSAPPDPTTDPDRGEFVDFYQDRIPGGDPQAERNLGVGLVKLIGAGRLRPERHGARAVYLLESALGQYPRDVELREAKAQALLLLDRHAEVLVAARAALERRPGNWRLLAGAAAAAQAEGQTELALDYWRRAVAINPGMPDYQVALVALLLRAEHFDEARDHCERLLRLDPFNVSGRQAWVGFLLRDGKQDEARRDFDVLRRLRPPDLAQREEWFRRQLK